MTMEARQAEARPVLRWAGSKKQLLPEIARYWHPGYRRYVEPFCGSASLFFKLAPESAFLSDLNEDLIETLRQLQSEANNVCECMGRLASDVDSYYRIRAQDPHDLSPNERAARFLYLNQHCFNGLYRVNRAGKFNVPYCASKRRAPLTATEIRHAGQLLSNATLVCADFQTVLESCSLGDFVYLDPPYASSASRSTFIEYGIDGFSEMDIGRLFDSLEEAAQRGVKFVLSYADVQDLQPYTKHLDVRRVQVRRNIAGFTGARRTVSELLVTNCEVPHG
jgi:DNA adenine methylase